MNVETKPKKKQGKKPSQPQASHLEAYLETQPEPEAMQTESEPLDRFDSLRTALLQCVQVRDQETLAALLRNDVEPVDWE